MKSKPKLIKVCPNCKSIRIAIWMGGQAGLIYRCGNCSYHGPIIIEADASKLKKKIK